LEASAKEHGFKLCGKGCGDPHYIRPMTQYDLLSGAILLLLITDPLGNIPIFANALKHVPLARRPQVIVREIGIAFLILLTFMFVGDVFLKVMGLSELSLQIAGAVVLFLIAIRMIFPPPEVAAPTDADMPQEPLIVPLAIPAVAGPSAIATVMLLVSQAPARRLEWVGALTVVMLINAAILLGAERIQRLVGERVVIALERLMGLVLVAISVEMLIRGIKALARQL
jgi:MarC family membrane protein